MSGRSIKLVDWGIVRNRMKDSSQWQAIVTDLFAAQAEHITKEDVDGVASMGLELGKNSASPEAD